MYEIFIHFTIYMQVTTIQKFLELAFKKLKKKLKIIGFCVDSVIPLFFLQ